MNINSPHIIEQEGMKFLKLRVPSKSTSTPRTITYYPSGKHFCDCPGHEWKVRKQSYTLPNHKRWCRHHSLTTLPILSDFKDRIYLYITKGYVKAAWQLMSCQFPEHHCEEQVHCSSCPLYPETCNIHPIRYGTRNRKPLVWKLQTAIFNERRAEAKRLFRKFCSRVKELRYE